MTASDPRALICDLADETAELEAMLDGLEERQWHARTPAAGWDIVDQVGHLAYFDEAALVSLVDPERFRRELKALVTEREDFPDQVAAEHRGMSGARVLDWFRRSRRALLDGYAGADFGARLPWYGPDMGVASSVTARLMETWAHGQDIADTIGVQRIPTSRLRHVAHLGVRALPYSYAINGLTPPGEPIRVELTAPDGRTWSWGPAAAGNMVTGPALDFALVVTRRRHRGDTAIAVTGSAALQWIGIAQAFAGAPGPGRPPLSGPGCPAPASEGV